MSETQVGQAAVKGHGYLAQLGLSETPAGTLGQSIAGGAVLGGAIAGDVNGGSVAFQSADRTVAPIGPSITAQEV